MGKGTMEKRKAEKGKGPRDRRKTKHSAIRRLEDEAQCWLRERFRLGKPTVIQSNSDGFYFMFAGDQSTYFCKWKELKSDFAPDLTAAKVH